MNLAPKLLLIPNSTRLYNSANPKGVVYKSNNIADGGIVIGNYNPSAGAYVTLRVGLPDAFDLACGTNDIRSVAVAQPKGLTSFYNTAEVELLRDC